MKINAIQNPEYNYNNNRNIKKNKTSFGKLIPTEDYLNSLIRNNKKETVEKLAQLCKKEINLKKLLNYDTLPPERKALMDEYFDAIEKSGGNIEDLDVVIDGRHGHVRSNDGLYRTLANIYAKLSAVLPEIDYKEGNLKIFPGYNTFVPKCHRIITVGGPFYKPLDKETLNGNYERTRNAMENMVGFTFNEESRLPVPSEKIYDILVKKINEDIDCIQQVRAGVAKDAAKQEQINNLKKIFQYK